MASDVNNIVITGTIFDNPKFVGIPNSTLTAIHFTLACAKGAKMFDPKYMFVITGVFKKDELRHISKGARVAIAGFISNVIDQGIEKTVIHCKDLIPLPVAIKKANEFV